MRGKGVAVLVVVLLLGCGYLIFVRAGGVSTETTRDDRSEVVFWHFWGGEDRRVVEEIVERFNASQDRHRVRAIAMPGNNLDMKLFLAVIGGDPPDVVNQDDPIVADWAKRGALHSLDELASPKELEALRSWLFPAAVRLGEYDGRLYALCNGLDIRALYFNRTMLDEYGLEPPKSLADLDRIAETIAPPGRDSYERVGYLPDSRRLWAWGVVFGGDFYDESNAMATVEDPAIVRALNWMASYRSRYGPERIAAFRQGDQSLPGSAFRLLPATDASPHGRYAVIMDGQWRVRDILATQRSRARRGLPTAEYGVCPLPPPQGGRSNAGWVNGNFFICPRGARNPQGAWEFMKFWCGFTNQEQEAAKTCAQGGWIPVSQAVVDHAVFQEFLQQQPLFRPFVELAASPQQHPIPVAPGAGFLNRQIKEVGGEVMLGERGLSATEALKKLAARLRQRKEQAP